jgi:hypothetical protein
MSALAITSSCDGRSSRPDTRRLLELPKGERASAILLGGAPDLGEDLFAAHGSIVGQERLAQVLSSHLNGAPFDIGISADHLVDHWPRYELSRDFGRALALGFESVQHSSVGSGKAHVRKRPAGSR